MTVSTVTHSTAKNYLSLASRFGVHSVCVLFTRIFSDDGTRSLDLLGSFVCPAMPFEPLACCDQSLSTFLSLSLKCRGLEQARRSFFRNSITEEFAITHLIEREYLT